MKYYKVKQRFFFDGITIEFKLLRKTMLGERSMLSQQCGSYVMNELVRFIERYFEPIEQEKILIQKITEINPIIVQIDEEEFKKLETKGYKAVY